MSKKRRTFSDDLKFKIVMEAIQGRRQISEIASEYDVHPQQITNWKKHFIEHGSSIFSKKADSEKEQLKEDKEYLLKKVGEQQMDLDFLKKSVKLMESWEKEK